MTLETKLSWEGYELQFLPTLVREITIDGQKHQLCSQNW